MKRTFFAIAFCFFAAGCFFQRPTQDGITRSTAAIQEDAALDLIEKRIAESSRPPAADPEAAAKPDQPAAEAPAAEIRKPDAAGDAILKYADCLYFAAYCLLALLAAWYIRQTGRQSETLQQISDIISRRLTIKYRILFRILRRICRRKK